jgi:hypothetical protein
MTLTDKPEDDERAVIMDGLRAYNEAQAGVWDGRPLAILAKVAPPSRNSSAMNCVTVVEKRLTQHTHNVKRLSETGRIPRASLGR